MQLLPRGQFCYKKVNFMHFMLSYGIFWGILVSSIYKGNVNETQRAYKQKRDKALEDMLQIYKENTRGIVPPTYTGSFQSEINTNQNK